MLAMEHETEKYFLDKVVKNKPFNLKKVLDGEALFST